MVSGRKTLGSIENAISEVQRSIQRIQNELKSANDKKAELLKNRLSAYRELAEFKVRDALYDNVIDESDNLAQQVNALLQAREKTIGVIRGQIKNIRDSRGSLLSAHEKVLDEIAACEAKLDTFAGTAEAELLKDQEYAQLSKSLETLKATCEKAETKARQAEQDSESKGAPYRSDILFMYLWKRQYGTREYFDRTKRVIEWLDAWVADLVKYYNAKANYTMLSQIPGRLNDHLERLKVEIDKVQKQIDVRKIEKITVLAGSDLTSALTEMRSRETALNEQIQKSDAEMSDATAQLNHFSEGRDYAFKKAIELSAQSLEHENFSDLLYEARQTDDPRDDKILERIKNIREDLEDLDEDIEDLQEDLQRLFKRKQDMVGIASDFRRNHYDDPGSQFSDRGNLEGMLGEVMKGAITAAAYWAMARQNQSWQSRPADPFRHSSGLPPFGGSRDSDRRDDVEIDFGDDDFRTGGDF